MKNNVAIHLRLAYQSETSALTDLAIRSKRSNGYSDSFMEACYEELTVTAASMSKGEYWVAESDRVHGFVCLTEGPKQGVGEVHSFFIDPDWQRMGIGRLLWRKIIKRAKLKGISSIFLDADPNAVPFYEALGFVVIGEVPSGSIKGRTIPRMEVLVV